MFEKLRQMLNFDQTEQSWFAAHRSFFIKLAFIILISYLAAGGLTASFLSKLTASFSGVRNLSTGDVGAVSSKNQSNYHEIRLAVLNRNIFNQTGEVPKEESDDTGQKGKGAFDIDAPCEKTALKIKLLGMIALEGDQGSIATIKEDGFESSDVYSEGDIIIGTESAQIVSIRRNKVIINNAGRKECLDLKLGDEKLQSAALGGGMAPLSEEFVVDLDAKFVQSELGEGFGKIIQSARLIPNTVNNQVNGFKIFAIHPGTVLEKAGFKENDVITKVNNTVMEAEQGFALYQALNDEKQIRVNVLRNGTIPKTIVIRVK